MERQFLGRLEARARLDHRRHGARHAYAQERMAELQRMLFCADALETVSQELGHFRPEITETYLR